MRLKDQVAIVTGVSHSGQVGIALASAMAREGAMLAISSHTAERVNEAFTRRYPQKMGKHRANRRSCNFSGVTCE